MTTKTLIKTTCSSCSADLKVYPHAGSVTSVVPSNGKRGSLHVPAHTVEADLDGDDDLLTWDCPACGEADSFDLND